MYACHTADLNPGLMIMLRTLARAVATFLYAILCPPLLAQPPCGDWNTEAFFENATVAQITNCLEAGANIEARDKDGWTPLHLVTHSGTADKVQALIKAGANTEARMEEGWTPLHSAVMFGSADSVQALIKAGGDIEARAEEGWTPLHMAASLGKVDAVQSLVKAGANIEARAEKGWTPLHAASEGVANEWQALMADVNIEARTKGGWTPPLHWTADHSIAGAVQVLVKAGANTEARTENGETPLHVAAIFSSGNAMTALLDAGANPRARNDEGKIPYDLASDNEYLRKHPAFWRLHDLRFNQPGD